jgi:hypothetical protein
MIDRSYPVKYSPLLFSLSLILSVSVTADPQRTTHLKLDQIESWHAPSDRELLVKSKDKNYRATFSTDCVGLSKAYTVAFITEKSHYLDASSAVRLPDGSRCNLKEFKLSCGADC